MTGLSPTKCNFARLRRYQVQLGNERKVAVARRRNGSGSVALGTGAAARDGYQKSLTGH